MPRRKSKGLTCSPEEAKSSGTLFRLGLDFSYAGTGGVDCVTLGWFRSSSDAFDEMMRITRPKLRGIVEPYTEKEGRQLEQVVVVVAEHVFRDGTSIHGSSVYESRHTVLYQEGGAFSLRKQRFEH